MFGRGDATLYVVQSLMSWIESTTNALNISLTLIIFFLGVRILRTMRFTLQRGSVRLFVGAALLFASKEVVASLEHGANVVWLHDVAEVLETGFILCLCCAMYMIVQSEKLEISGLHRQVHRDTLTGLLNLAAFTRLGTVRVKHAQTNGLPLTLIMLDVDKFKQYNDTYGHEAGNVALQAISTALRHAARETDLVSRYGGEEFVLLLFTSPDAAYAAAERIRNTIEAECCPDANPSLQRALTASLGVSRLDSATHNLKSLIEAADHQLYEAKHAGRNRVSLASESLTSESLTSESFAPPELGIAKTAVAHQRQRPQTR